MHGIGASLQRNGTNPDKTTALSVGLLFLLVSFSIMKVAISNHSCDKGVYCNASLTP